jgi:pimeloyl-ACP methyl ester carboxylesterase
VRQGPTDRRQEVDIAQNAFVLGNNFVGHLDLALAIEAPPRDRKTSLTFFSINGLRDLPYTLEPVTGPAASEGAVFRDSLGEILHLDRNGRLERVEMPAQKVVFRRADEPVERFVIEAPQAAAPAGDLDREEVRIEHGEISLAGTITRPLGATGPFPTVFFVSGSGGQDRNGVSSGIDVGTHEILDRLTREGFLVLRVDDRGTGESRGPTAELTFDDLVEDARACVRFLQERSDVDRSRIAVIGHSEGGLTATILAVEMELAAVVLMAAPGRGLRDLMREQLARGRKLSGAGAEELADFDRAVSAFFEQVDGGDPIDADALPAELRPFVGAGPWLRSHASRDPVASLKQVRAPVLLLQGARDLQVSLERDAQRLLAALDEIGHADHELIVFPELDHLFKRTVGEESSGLDYLKTRPVDPGFLDTLASWLRDHLAGNARDA